MPGTRLRIDGVFPYARYTSWNRYDLALRPFAKLSDFQLQPNPGSANPYLPGAARDTPVAERRYTLYITFSASDHPGPNTIYVDPADHPPMSATGSPSLASPCRDVEKPTSSEVTGAYAGQNGAGAGPPYPGRNAPDWHKLVNLCQSGADLLFDNALGDQAPQTGQDPCSNFGSGGLQSNLDNAYVYTFLSQGFGPIAVFHGRAPTFAATHPSAATMPGGVQVRYWSFCQNDPFSERYVACLRDDQVPTDAGGDYTIVVAPPSSWPPAAQQRCGGVAGWIPWGPQPQGVVLYRQMLPDPSFSQAIANVGYGSEAAQMGAYYPAGRYFPDWQAVAQAFCPS